MPSDPGFRRRRHSPCAPIRTRAGPVTTTALRAASARHPRVGLEDCRRRHDRTIVDCCFPWLDIKSLRVHSPPLGGVNQLAIQRPSLPHVGADLRVRSSEEGAHTGAPLLQLNAHPGGPGGQLRSRLFRRQRNHHTLVVDHGELARTSGDGESRLARNVVTR